MNELTTTTENTIQIYELGLDLLDLLPSWLQYLVAAYPTTKLVKKTFAMMEDQFQDVDGKTMDAAVRRHVARSEWWPKASELRAIVDALPYETAAQVARYGRFTSETGQPYTDDDLLAFEVRRGTMAPLIEIEAEIEQARRELETIKR
jgi:hypothetical protein